MAKSERPGPSELARTVVASARAKPVPITALSERGLRAWRGRQTGAVRAWLKASAFEARPDTWCLLPDREGKLRGVLAGVADPVHAFSLAALPGNLPPGTYRMDDPVEPAQLTRLAVGWGLAGYAFSTYRSGSKPLEAAKRPRLVVEDERIASDAQHMIDGIALCRDLINTPAGDMMPEHLSAVAAGLARDFGARFTETVGQDLLSKNYPAIHAVGRASVHAPRLIELSWGKRNAPRLTLVGKGVCFDSGGLDLKSASGMRLMKKDMGGAAHALGLARIIMAMELPVRLRVLIPAVENAVSGSSYRPGDVVPTRAGVNIEIDNTDAEGRVVLSDALCEACREKPEILIDFATLTGAARVALGTDLPAMFCNDDALADALADHGEGESDPVWRLPLHAPYRELIESKVADVMNSGATPFGGAITAALFLERFVEPGVSWAHFDLMAWNPKGRPGRPEGGEAMGVRMLAAYLRARYAGTG